MLRKEGFAYAKMFKIMLKRASIRIKGDVQMAGFRTFIKNTADSLNVNGFAENLEDGSVRVVCEGEEGAMEGLINSVKQNPPSFVRIEEVAVAYEEYKGEFSNFERCDVDVPGEEGAGVSEMVALMRSFDKKGEVMIGILSSMNGTLGSMNGTLKGVKEDTSKMLEKQDKTIDAIDRSKEEIVTQISSLSQPFSF